MLLRFDEFLLDGDTFELRYAGTVRAVEPLVFDLIWYLAGNPGRVIGRDEVIARVWKGRVVSDATVSSCIKAARRALGDDGDTQSYIRTVRGRGYQFVAEVEPVVDREAGAGEPGAARAPTEVAEPAPPREKPVLAVLPFENLSAGVDDYFADGLTEDIITNLSRFRELLVVGRSSTFRFKERPFELADVRAMLHAEYVVEGSVRRAAGRVRITAQLLDASTGVHLWADTYDREMEDILAVQDEVTRTIAATLGVKIQDVATQRALKKSAAELDAYDCVLRARRYTATLSETMHAEARDLLEQAVAKDPTHAEAHALLANVYLAEHRFDANPRPDPIGRALEMAQIATRLDPQSAYARCWLGIVHFFRGENDRFEAEAERALALNPNDPETLADIGHYLAFMGAFERGLELSRRARQLNPLHPGWYFFSSARYHYDRRAYEAVLADLERIGMPSFYWTHLLRAAALGQLGRPEARASLEEVRRLKPGFSARVELAKWNAAPDDLEHLMEGLRRAGLRE
jgi:TolB-like protein